jgi:hypothetical protein
MAETGLMTPGNFSHEILGQLQVALRTGQADVAKVCGEKWQLCAKIGVLFAPQQKAKDSHRMQRILSRVRFGKATDSHVTEGTLLKIPLC